ncbi:MAG: MFS transporter [Nanoarchaeota archaeon]|nr:MFS transporter [Nanoarchaeota archaeon]
MKDLRKKPKKISSLLLERNINLLYAIGSLGWARFFIPVLALFYIASQVPLEQFGIIMGIYALVILLLEIPSGVFSDILGRKWSLLIAYVLFLIELIILAFFNGFWPFLIAKILCGIAGSLVSGTQSALLYESLKKLKREKEYKKIFGKLHFITNIVKACVFIFGAYLFTLNPKYPAFLSIPFTLFALILTFYLHEVFVPNKKLTIKNQIKHMKEGLSYFIKNKYTKLITIHSSFLMMIPWIILSISSAYLEIIKIPIVLIGIFSFTGNVLQALGAKKAHYLEEKFGEKKTLSLLYGLSFAGVFPLIFLIPYFGILSLLLVYPIRSLNIVIIDYYMNRHIKETHRATILSIRNMFNKLVIAICFPIFGYITKISSMAEAFAFLFIVSGIGFVYYLIYQGKYMKTQKNKTYI